MARTGHWDANDNIRSAPDRPPFLTFVPLAILPDQSQIYGLVMARYSRPALIPKPGHRGLISGRSIHGDGQRAQIRSNLQYAGLI